jgi:hypothetical protein
VDYQNRNGRTALMAAAAGRTRRGRACTRRENGLIDVRARGLVGGDILTCIELLRAGASLTMLDNEGKTPGSCPWSAAKFFWV